MSNLVKRLIDRDADLYMNQLMRAQCVLFDDLDKAGIYRSGWVKDQIFNLIDRRIGADKLIMATTNLIDPGQFVEKFGEATTSRLLGVAQFVEFKGKDYRQKQKGDR